MPSITDDPQVAAYLRGLMDREQRMATQMKSLLKAYKQLAQQNSDNQLVIGQLRDAVKKAAERIRYIEDIPGKRVPYFLNFNVPIPGPSNPSVSLAGSRLPATQTISTDGPFVATSLMAAFLMKTYSIGPYGTIDPPDGRPGDPPIGTEVISPFTGRWRPIASTADPFSGAYIGVGLGPDTVADAQAVQTFRPGTIDFLFEIMDSGSNRTRQNEIPSSSRYLFTEFDRPAYLPASDFFTQNSVITLNVTLTRDLGFVENNYAALPNGFAEGDAQPPPDPTVSGNIGRQVLAVGGVLYFTMLGYKILQAQSPAV